METQDGRVFTGDILVGGDGIKSRTRHEMWRLMEADNHSTVADRKGACVRIISPLHGQTNKI